MGTPRIDYARELIAELRTMLDAADLAQVMVSIDPLDIPSGARHGIVVISPPDLTFTTYTQTEAAYELAAIAGPADNLLAAWERLDGILEALRVGGLNMDTARGDMFAPKNGQPLPGYTITLHPDTLID